jgi:hypothetical protein
MSHADGHFSALKKWTCPIAKTRFVTGHDFSRAAAVPGFDSALAAAELQITQDKSPQGFKPSYLFCRSYGMAEAVPCYKTIHLLPKSGAENGLDFSDTPLQRWVSDFKASLQSMKSGIHSPLASRHRSCWQEFAFPNAGPSTPCPFAMLRVRSLLMNEVPPMAYLASASKRAQHDISFWDGFWRHHPSRKNIDAVPCLHLGGQYQNLKSCQSAA